MGYKDYLLFILASALWITPLLNMFGIPSTIDGLEYYAEVHQSKWNCIIHTIGMPFTVYGISCWVAALFPISAKNKNKLQLSVWSLYIGHYLSINLLRGSLCCLYYAVPTYLAYRKVNIINKESKENFWWLSKKLFLYGFCVSAIALFTQETIGHYFGGDNPSRPEGVLNAIIYAPLFSTYHLY